MTRFSADAAPQRSWQSAPTRSFRPDVATRYERFTRGHARRCSHRVSRNRCTPSSSRNRIRRHSARARRATRCSASGRSSRVCEFRLVRPPAERVRFCRICTGPPRAEPRRARPLGRLVGAAGPVAKCAARRSASPCKVMNELQANQPKAAFRRQICRHSCGVPLVAVPALA